MKDYKDHNSLSNLINQNDQNHEEEDKIMNVHETKEENFTVLCKFYLHSKSAIKKCMITHICTPAIYCPLIEYVSLPVY